MTTATRSKPRNGVLADIVPLSRTLARANWMPPEEWRASGKMLRDAVPRKSHAGWQPGKKRRDPIEIIIESNAGRLAELVPIRHGRMLQSAFAFLRGSAAIMAADLATAPATGIHVQACGDCHLLNFGGFATPERNQIFDINDFDETLPAPWEWDVKRLCASLVVAGRHIALKEREAESAARAAVAAYREHIREYARMHVLDVWYERIDSGKVLPALPSEARDRLSMRAEKIRRRRVIEHDFPKLAEKTGKGPRIRDDPPLIFHHPFQQDASFEEWLQDLLQEYRESLQEDRRVLFDQFRFCDAAMKVVGVGSVGTVCAVLLFMAADHDPLFLQIKEARPSVLEPYAGARIHANDGKRVVTGQRLMQAASDIFLGWTSGTKDGRHHYIRQLRDMKLSAEIETMDANILKAYGGLCGWVLARAHARSGSAATIAGYLGSTDEFDEAVTEFATDYADQTELDHKRFAAAIRGGRLQARIE
jgi:uncharacterized protein (DUF2252 family)